MRAVDIITKKRDGQALSQAEIAYFVNGFASGEIPDYQTAAWAMAVMLRGMDELETTALTLAMAQSGQVLDLSSVGRTIAERSIEKGIKRVVFDRSGFLYHGRIRAVADAARKAGLEF